MKKYFLMLTTIISCLLLSFIPTKVSAQDDPLTTSPKATISKTDEYNDRKIGIEIVYPYTLPIGYVELYELKVCSSDDNDSRCQVYPDAVNENKDFSEARMKIVGEINKYTFDSVDLVHSFDYEIKTQVDGNIYFLIRTYNKDSGLFPGQSAFLEYKLSTINQRVVINPDQDGIPLYTFDKTQYTKTSDNTIGVKYLEDEINNVYGNSIYVCEVIDGKDTNCILYDYRHPIRYNIKSYGNGKKTLDIHLIKKDAVIENMKFTQSNSTSIKKDIILDNIGPEITVEGGGWIYLPTGEKYKQQGAKCKDALFSDDECVVTNDLDLVKINYNDDRYQFVTYQAKDRLGNITNYVVRVKVEIIHKDTNILPIVLSCTFVLLTTFTILGVVLYKNHQKKKKLSYI